MTTNPPADAAKRDPDWLAKQLKAWPTRIHPESTTNVQVLMQKAAEKLAAQASQIEALTKERDEARSAYRDAADGWESASKSLSACQVKCAALSAAEAKVAKMREALDAASAIRPENWDEGSDPEQEAAWRLVDAALDQEARP